jgi:hypothetical protein
MLDLGVIAVDRVTAITPRSTAGGFTVRAGPALSMSAPSTKCSSAPP